MERLFEFLFKYRPIAFARGELVFTPPWPVGLVLALGVVAAGLAALAYRRSHATLAPRDRLTALGLRAGAMALLVFSLAGPALRLSSVVPQENLLGILLDDSRSMQVADEGGRPRGAVAAAAFATDAPVMRALGERFRVRLFRFSDRFARADSSGALDYRGRRTDLGAALAAARRELGTAPLAGLVVVSDGAANAGDGLDEPLLALAADHVPVHVVALGSETLAPDIELTRVAVPRAVLQGASVAVELSVRAAGYGGRNVPLQVEDGGKILSRTEIHLPRGGEPTTVRAHFTADDPGARRLRFQVPVQDGELIAENNTVEALVVVERRVERILYFEGEPRFEVKFLRRAVADDDRLEVVTLLRTAQDKYLRLGVKDSMELVAGFPRTRAELFRYRGLILGSVEASFFTHDQLQMLADFVSVRGGGLLALGGGRAFAEGGWGATPLADVLPVVLESPAPQRTDSTRFFAGVAVEPTSAGFEHPVLQLRDPGHASPGFWDSLPKLSLLNPIHEAKPGASVLLTGNGRGGPYVLLATQRYGRGRAVAFTVQDSWIWQMDAGLPLEDQTHETLWRQLLRYLVSDVPQPVTATLSADRVEPGRSVTLTAEVSDSGYVKVNDAEVRATIVDPGGTVEEIPLRWTVRRDGEFEARITPQTAGLEEIRVTASLQGHPLGEATTYLDAGDVGAEYFGAERQTAALRRIAEETGGRFYTPATLRTLPEDVSYTESGATVVEYRELWDMPILLLLLIGLLGAEWAWRRRRGLA